MSSPENRARYMQEEKLALVQMILDRDRQIQDLQTTVNNLDGQVNRLQAHAGLLESTLRSATEVLPQENRDLVANVLEVYQSGDVARLGWCLGTPDRPHGAAEIVDGTCPFCGTQYEVSHTVR